MNIQEIKDAVNSGKPVRWVNNGYHVTRNDLGREHVASTDLVGEIWSDRHGIFKCHSTLGIT